MRSTTPSTVVALAALVVASALGWVAPAEGQTPELGVGVVQPPIDPERPLYFYAIPRAGWGPETATPSDSVVFAADEHHVGISSAPPWFAPEGLKLDYDLLWLRARTLTRFWIEVEVNTLDPRPRFVPETAWVAREAVSFRPWSEFLLEVFSVETTGPADNPLRSGPAAEAEVVGDSSGLPLRPLALSGDWLRVEAVEGGETDRPRGWIRWRGDGVLLVSFSLLS